MKTIDKNQRGKDSRLKTHDSPRIGFGLDIHPFKTGRPLVLGGVNVPCQKGLQGHSDADVLVHAVMDALLGSAGLGDIGIHFPGGDPKYKNISSLLLLKKVEVLIKKKGFSIQNIDSTLTIEEPKISHLIPNMRKKISSILSLSPDQVNIKATRAEGLGFVGRVEGVCAYAVCLLC
ncbi:MAG: 2-C-methyl-D-erythritol 2,4-cyclodiphosphate synthase [Chlamydiae bacterium]|nr:2-C-methyl-D-erythritol 2,4-cyclodiphosphate synthase [Chlamydiota bacterium]MBI3276802.1 2-C-methyl-D-erythritol 2,4-cyclodiphosphate synthase [Chlamydiota bacterium]